MRSRRSKSTDIPDWVLEDIAGGRAAGVGGTPTFFLNGERLVGTASAGSTGP